MLVIVTDVDISEDRMAEHEKKVNIIMKAVEERDYEIASLKNHIESRDAGIKSRTVEELATKAHDMKLSIANRGNNDLLVPKIRKDKKEVKRTQKVLKSVIKEAMVISTTSLKFVSKEKKIERR
ncbi:ty3-gypsy retrotransposon protein [Cucumis melo var. makuwa]|uniref:Ty3-gypsy retrotransposon protein n=1 Tax=Cucumis melo var. makuwa TaxID=1194695 RepID=A0A5D3BN80_CUCMM|nr:ty3-gypsy retrotransposon protein [Cucumis melo var. makuwa]